MCDRCATACPAQAISYGPRHTVAAAAGAGAGAGAGRTVAAQEKTKTKKKTTTTRKTEKPSGAASSEAEAEAGSAGGGGAGGGSMRSGEYHNVSNLIGVSKWTTNAEKCFSYWTQSNAACSVCIRVCPYNRTSDGAGSGHGDRSITIAQRVSDSAWRQLASSTVGRRWCQRLALAWDDASGRAQRLRPATWWKLSTKGKGKGNKQQPQLRGASGAGAGAAAGRQ
jgi:Fe-S-cluster-containing hydrogenase component 2